MSLDNADCIDALGNDRDTGEVILNLIDAWVWAEEHHHLLRLQEKLNCYLAFVESGQIAEHQPGWRSVGVCINVIFKHQPPASAVALLKAAEFVAQSLRIRISHQVYPGT